MRRFDELAGGEPVFQPLADDYLERTGFPDIERDLAALGVKRHRDKTVSLDEQAPLAAIAAGIMGTASDSRRARPSPAPIGD